MAYERNSFRSVGPGTHMLGSVIEYDASRRRRKPHGGWRWPVYAVAFVAVLISFISARGCFRSEPSEKKAERKPPVETPATDLNGGQKPAPAEKEKVKGTPPPAVRSSHWTDGISGRTPREQTLLLRLADAERQGRLEIAVDTIERLRAIPSMADLNDKLARRLGDLNTRRLFSGEPVPWVVETTVRRGQSVHRIAREHGTTVAAIRQLNGLSPTEEPEVGRTLRVLEFVRAAFVVHKATKYADLTLNGKLFKRYYVSAGKNAKPGAYPITRAPDEGPRSRFSSLGILVAPADMRELDMFLAPGSTLTISEM